jgi:hypothetical protein
MKVYGASIYCVACHAEPFPPEGSDARETFDLLRFSDGWRCELHRIPGQRVPRAAVVTVKGALVPAAGNEATKFDPPARAPSAQGASASALEASP